MPVDGWGSSFVAIRGAYRGFGFVCFGIFLGGGAGGIIEEWRATERNAEFLSQKSCVTMLNSNNGIYVSSRVVYGRGWFCNKRPYMLHAKCRGVVFRARPVGCIMLHERFGRSWKDAFRKEPRRKRLCIYREIRGSDRTFLGPAFLSRLEEGLEAEKQQENRP